MAPHPRAASSINETTDDGLSVSQVNQSIAKTLEDRFPEAFWVKGELQGYDRDAAKAGQRRWGQVYFELIEKEPGADTVRASIKAVLWGDAQNTLRRKLAEVSGDLKLQDGLSVKVLCTVDFYWPRASLQLKVVDVDPHFTLGDMERARRELLEKLKKSGRLEKNRSLPFPELPLGVGLITSDGSAAYHDFVQELKSSGYAFTVYFVDAHTQGAETEREVSRALRQLGARPEVQVVALIRGGGSRSDLIWFDKEKIAEAVADCPVPVVTGIGHEIDSSVADIVAHTARKTPTAVAQFLVERVDAVDRLLADHAGALVRGTRALLDRLGRDLSSAAGAWREAAGTTLARSQGALREQRGLLAAALKRQLGMAGERLRTAPDRLDRSVRAVLVRASERLAAAGRECALKDPRRLLERGYSLLYAGGRLAKGVRDIKPGEFIEARLSDGTLSANVLGVTRSGKGKSE